MSATKYVYAVLANFANGHVLVKEYKVRAAAEKRVVKLNEGHPWKPYSMEAVEVRK